jgi:hypothetical protein
VPEVLKNKRVVPSILDPCWQAQSTAANSKIG